MASFLHASFPKSSHHSRSLMTFRQKFDFSSSIFIFITVFENHQKSRIFKKPPKLTIFGIFPWTFAHSKCKHSLRSQCWMRLFLWFSTTVFIRVCLATARLDCIPFRTRAAIDLAQIQPMCDLVLLWKQNEDCIKLFIWSNTIVEYIRSHLPSKH